MSLKFNPTVDIIISALNEERSIGLCLQALKNQDYPADLINVYVVVDRCTVDNTAGVAEQFGVNVTRATVTGIAPVRDLGFAKGQSELVAFIDAHCVPSPNWASAMVAPFADPVVGGCQGRLESVCASAATRRFLTQSLFSSEQRTLEHTIEGRFSPYPWVLGGNSMFRRRAIEETGPLENCPCDDTDRSWKVFLLGYQFAYAPAAEVLHQDHATLYSYLKKHYVHGVGAAQLAYAYGFSGKRRLSSRKYARTAEVLLIDLIYGAGFSAEQRRQRRGLIALAKRRVEPVQARFRPLFSWSSAHDLQINPHTVYWLVGSDRVIAVQLMTGARFEFDGVANAIFRQLIEGHDKVQTCAALTRMYNTSSESVAQDVEDFVQQLAQEGTIHVVGVQPAPTAERVSLMALTGHS